MSLALIGAGAMGGAIGARLCAVGQPLRVLDLDAEKVAALVALGAEAAPTAADAARGAEAVILSLNSPRIVEIAARRTSFWSSVRSTASRARSKSRAPSSSMSSTSTPASTLLVASCSHVPYGSDHPSTR